MRLRRLIQHLKDQNWFAVILDFIIVVIGVGAALMAQQWLSDRQIRADFDRAMDSISNDLFRIYFVSSERLAIADCRRERYAELGELLLQTDQPWIGAPREYREDVLASAFPTVLRSPHRYWSSRIWEAELAKGTLALMNNEDQLLMTTIFSAGAEAEEIQMIVRDLEASLQILAHPLELAPAERLRYFETLARADSAQSLLDLRAQQNIGFIDESSLRLVISQVEHEAYRQFVSAQNNRLVELYGDCVVPMAFSFLSEPDET